VAVAERIAANAPLAVAAVLDLLRQEAQRPLGERDIADALLELLRSDDAAEGMAAFAERRPPAFSGR
jgi:enoyl-CoA hydratase/carnithine racemase